MTMLPAMINLDELAAHTGLSVEMLRLWQGRFGFPVPQASLDGEPVYPFEHVARLRLIRIAVSLGQRPARVFAMDVVSLDHLVEDLLSDQRGTQPETDELALSDCLRLVRENGHAALEARMRSHIIAHGLSAFVLRLAAPLCHAVGLAWERGHISIFQEHIFSDVFTRVVQTASTSLFSPDMLIHGRPSPAVMLATVSGEGHTLGLTMVEAMLRLGNAHVTMLGAQTPLGEIAHAARAFRSDIVALSFSLAFSPDRARQMIGQIRQMLDPNCTLWVGGANAALHAALPTGVVAFRNLEGLNEAVEEWRACHRPVMAD